MALPPRNNPDSNDDATPATTPGLEGGGSVGPGDTPPTAGQMSGTAPDAREAPNMGPVSGNRTPMIITLVVLALLVLAVLGYGVAEIAAYLREDPLEDPAASLGALAAAAPLR